jgi:hypothetical protein
MMMAAGVGAVGSLAGGLLGSSAAKKQIEAMREAIEYQKQKDAQTRNDLAPYRKFGADQLGDLSGWLDSDESNPMSFLDPGYDFRRNEGMKGITGNAGTAGLLQSGDTLRGIQQYGQNLASNEYGNAFNRRIQEGQFRQGMAGMGQNAAVSGGYLANQGAANVGNLTADTDWGGPEKVWGDAITGVAGAGSNAFARMGGRGMASAVMPKPPSGSDFNAWFGP